MKFAYYFFIAIVAFYCIAITVVAYLESVSESKRKKDDQVQDRPDL